MAVSTLFLSVTLKHRPFFSFPPNKRNDRAPADKCKWAPPGAFLICNTQTVRPSIAPNQKQSAQAGLETEYVALGYRCIFLAGELAQTQLASGGNNVANSHAKRESDLFRTRKWKRNIWWIFDLCFPS